MSVSEKQLAANRMNAARSTGPRTTDGKARSAQNARKHGFASAAYTIVRAEGLEDLADLRSDLISVYQPVNSQEVFALERVALFQQTLLRAARLEAGLFSCGVNLAVDVDGAFRTQPSLDFTESQGYNHAFADGFIRMVKQDPDVWKLYLRYQAQAERNYRRAMEEFDRLRALRDQLPNEPISDPEPEPDQPLTPPPPEPVPPPEPAPPAPPALAAPPDSPNPLPIIAPIALSPVPNGPIPPR